jgi:phage tail tape-measure protein
VGIVGKQKEKNRMRKPATIAALAGLGLLTACGATEPDRAQGGAAAGAATGATFGLIGGPVGVVIGGLIGGAAGATTGAVTSPRHLNLGDPPWSDNPSDQTTTATP